MKILVTGGAGFIGSAVIRHAIADGLSVVNVDKLTYAANLDNLAGLSDDARYCFVQADICDGPAMAGIFTEHQPDAVMHLAAESHVDRSIEGPLAFIQTNVMGTAVLLEETRRYLGAISEARRSKFRFHHVSTDEVFGTLGETGAFDEETPYRPNSPYSSSKAASDMLVRAWGETFGLPYVISNCSNNYGPCQFPEKLIPVVILNAISEKPIPVYGTGGNVRDWLFVDDHADALLTVLQRGQSGQTYCIGGEAERSNLQLVHMLCSILDELRPRSSPYSDLITFVKDRPGHDFRYAIDTSKIQQELNWRPATNIDQGLRKTVEWYLANEAWWQSIRQRGFQGDRLGLIAAK